MPAVVALVESAYRGDESRKGWTTEADLLDGQRTDAEEVAGLVARPTGRLVLAESNGELVGCCHLGRRDGRVASLGMFAVRPDAQGRHVGRAILAEAERIASLEWAASAVRMNVLRQRTELFAWYGARGYEPTGETAPFPYGDERFGVPRVEDLEFVVLEKRLS